MPQPPLLLPLLLLPLLLLPHASDAAGPGCSLPMAKGYSCAAGFCGCAGPLPHHPAPQCGPASAAAPRRRHAGREGAAGEEVVRRERLALLWLRD